MPVGSDPAAPIKASSAARNAVLSCDIAALIADAAAALPCLIAAANAVIGLTKPPKLMPLEKMNLKSQICAKLLFVTEMPVLVM